MVSPIPFTTHSCEWFLPSIHHHHTAPPISSSRESSCFHEILFSSTNLQPEPRLHTSLARVHVHARSCFFLDVKPPPHNTAPPSSRESSCFHEILYLVVKIPPPSACSRESLEGRGGVASGSMSKVAPGRLEEAGVFLFPSPRFRQFLSLQQGTWSGSEAAAGPPDPFPSPLFPAACGA